jgi:signal transduction histidine kinase
MCIRRSRPSPKRATVVFWSAEPGGRAEQISGWLSRVAAIALLALLAGLALVLSQAWMVNLDREPNSPASRHVTHVSWLTVPGGSVDGALPGQTSDLSAAGRPTTLPHAWSRAMLTGGGELARETHWLQLSLADLPPDVHTDRRAATQGLVLYLPRWQAVGRIAVYADDRRVYRSGGDPAWSAFNVPLWVPLNAGGSLPRPSVVRVRIDSVAGAGGSVSSLWIGPASDLAAMHDLRETLQTGLMEHLSVAALALALFAFVLWLLDRRERLFLLFAVFALVWLLRGLRFQVGTEPLPIPAAWFGWIINNSANALLVTWFLFVAALVPAAPKWLGQALVGLLVASALVTLPWLAAVPHIELTAPLSYAVTILAGVPTLIYMAWLSWRPGGGAEGRIATAVGLIHVPVAVHDWMLQSHQINPEGYYWWPISTTTRLLLFAAILLRRYVRAVKGVERANLELSQRLIEREQALNASHEALREARERETLVRERQRLMQDIHDGMGSQLIGALKRAEAGQLRGTDMAAVLRECLDDLKLTVDSLEPVEADLLLLLATLRYRLAPAIEAAGLRVNWQVQDLPPLTWLTPPAALHILRILQEAVSNVMRHAQATELRVSTAVRDGGVVVVIDDDGVGLDGGTGPAAEPPRAGHGLSNMARRAQAIGGRLSWQPLPTGSCLTLWLPMQPPATAGTQKAAHG